MKPFGFGVPSYKPGAVQSQGMGPLYRNQNPDEEYQRMMAMMDTMQPRALAPMQPQTSMAQPEAAPIKAPKDRGMFGRFKDFNPLRFDPDKGVGEGNRLYALGATLAGMGSGDPALTAGLLEPKLQANRERVEKEKDEAKRRLIAQSMGLNADLAAMDLGMGIQAKNRTDDLALDAERYGDTRADRAEDVGYRDTVYGDSRTDRAEDVGYRDTQAEEDKRRFGLNYGLGLRGVQAAEAKAAAEAEALKLGGTPSGLTEDQMKMEIDLSNRWAPIQKNYEDIRSQFGRIATLGAQLRPNGEPFDPAQQAVNDLALVVAFTKMLDPGSVAREGEVELTKKSASLLGEASTWLPRLQKGGTLLPAETRKALVQAATDMMPVYDDAYENMADQNYARVTDYGLEPERVMLGYQWAEDAPENETFKGGQDTPKPPPGLPPDVAAEWQYLTPEERALWQKPAAFPNRITF
jgi:hypothetical protein